MTRNQKRRALREHRRKTRWAQKNKDWLRKAFEDVGWGYYASPAHIWSEFYFDMERGHA